VFNRSKRINSKKHSSQPHKDKVGRKTATNYKKAPTPTTYAKGYNTINLRPIKTAAGNRSEGRPYNQTRRRELARSDGGFKELWDQRKTGGGQDSRRGTEGGYSNTAAYGAQLSKNIKEDTYITSCLCQNHRRLVLEKTRRGKRTEGATYGGGIIEKGIKAAEAAGRKLRSTDVGPKLGGCPKKKTEHPLQIPPEAVHWGNKGDAI